jgi:hypothetical protein
VLKPNYQFEKRQREQEKKKKKAEKANRKASAPDGTPDQVDEQAAPGSPDANQATGPVGLTDDKA